MLVYGGINDEFKSNSDVHIYDESNNSWEKPKIDGVPPLNRHSHVMGSVKDGLCVIIFGGIS